MIKKPYILLKIAEFLKKNCGIKPVWFRGVLSFHNHNKKRIVLRFDAPYLLVDLWDANGKIEFKFFGSQYPFAIRKLLTHDLIQMKKPD